MLLYAALHHPDGEPMIGLWPPTARWLSRPPATAPTAVTPAETYHSAYLMEDMTAVLAGVSADPPRLRGNDYALFARSRDELEARFVAAPGWALELTALVGVTDRVELARAVLGALGFVQAQGEFVNPRASN
jgi:hypothetical protein